jgi:hypothetical protein
MMSDEEIADVIGELESWFASQGIPVTEIPFITTLFTAANLGIAVSNQKRLDEATDFLCSMLRSAAQDRFDKRTVTQ